MRVTVCVDALSPQLSGIGRYTWELCKGLASRAELSSLQFYVGGSLIDDPSRLLSDEHYRPNRRRPSRWLYRWQARRALRRTLVHGPNYFLPLEAHLGIVTIHDLSVFRHPEMHPVGRLESFEQQFASSVTRAAHVITDTETIRRELIGSFSVPAGKVTAVPLGVDPSFHPMDEREVTDTLAHWGLSPGSYGLSVAAFEPRKKLAELIGAWRRLPDKLRQNCPLVLAGGAGWRNEDLNKEIVSAQSEGWLKHLGFVPEAQLPKLYAGARLFIYPSVYEGFGLPPVEAMASGVPVIVSGRSCLPEVCGDAAKLTDPDDLEGFATAIEASLSSSKWRSEAITRGLDRARSFTWDRCIRDTIAIYREVWG